MRSVLVGCLLLAASLPVAAADGAEEVGRVKAMRSEVLKDLFASEDKSAAVAVAYKSLFTHVGVAGLKRLANDEDTSIALQAAWELHRKPVKRAALIRGRTDWVFDQKPIEEFLTLAAKRLKSKPPAWWEATLLNGEAFPGRHHAFIDKRGPLPSTATVKAENDEFVITWGKQFFSIPSKAAGHMDNGGPVVVLPGAELSFIAKPKDRGYPYEIVGVDSKTGRRLWASTVWAARRGFSSGPKGVHPVEIRREGGTVIVYGCESHGMYAEGFDATTGECQFRFCTCYWFNFSEAWSLN